MGRRILFVTSDQQRYDALGCNGGAVARTPVVDGLAAEGVNFRRALPQNVVCMPSRATMVTGQHVRTHGVWMNGVPLPADAPSVARLLQEHGYRTGLFGKAHFEPFLAPGPFYENRMAAADEFGPHRGFERMELATHASRGFTHYAVWLQREHPGHLDDYYPVLDGRLEVNADPGGDTGAVQVGFNPIPRGLYHTEWTADRAIAWLESLDADDDWFCWVSFPDPHHPWDPPTSELHRVPWRDLDLPVGYPRTAAERERILDGRPRHWKLWYEGELCSNFEAPPGWAPASLTADQVREINARIHVKNELIDEAIGRLLGTVARRGWLDDTDVVVTADHGEFQGDFGLLFKGPYHVDSLMRLPLIWRPAANAGVDPAEVLDPVGLVDLAPTFCSIAGVPAPEWMEGRPLPPTEPDARARPDRAVLTEWDSVHPNGTEMHLRTVTLDGWVCTVYEPGTVHDGSEGELYRLADDPLQHRNLWDDPRHRPERDALVAELRDRLRDWAAPRREVLASV